MQLSNRNYGPVNPPYNFPEEAYNISKTLNCAISKLKNNKVEEGLKIMYLVKEMLVEMNRQYDQHYFQQNSGKCTYAELTSAKYNYSWNKRNIKRLDWCLDNLNSDSPDVPIVLEVLRGKCDLP